MAYSLVPIARGERWLVAGLLVSVAMGMQGGELEMPLVGDSGPQAEEMSEQGSMSVQVAWYTEVSKTAAGKCPATRERNIRTIPGYELLGKKKVKAYHYWVAEELLPSDLSKRVRASRLRKNATRLDLFSILTCGLGPWCTSMVEPGKRMPDCCWPYPKEQGVGQDFSSGLSDV